MGKKRKKRRGWRKLVKRAGKYLGQGVSYAAPVVGTIIGGPAGAALGTAVGAGGAKLGWSGSKKERKAMKRTLMIGAGSAAVDYGLGQLGGTSLGGVLGDAWGFAKKTFFGGGGEPGVGQEPGTEPGADTESGRPNILEQMFGGGGVDPETGQPTGGISPFLIMGGVGLLVFVMLRRK